MEKKNECEIVQDLLLSYADGVLNNTSKKLVEEHLAQCKECSEKLKQIQNEANITNKEKLKRDIDYLKKYRRKSKIKSVIMSIGIVCILFMCVYLYKFSILNGLINKYGKSLESENFYKEEISVDTTTDTIFTKKTWYKDGKFKIATYQKQEGKEEIMLGKIQYGNIKEKFKIYIDDEQNTVTKTYYPWSIKKTNILPAENPIGSGYEMWQFRLGAPFYVDISTDTYKIGREYYVLKLNKSELWVDKETGLPIQSKGYMTSVQYYEGTNIEKDISEGITENRYQFDIVKDEDVTIPNLEGYTFLEDNSIIELIEKSK